MIDYLDHLDQRRKYLDARIEAKKKVGWETIYDERERDALVWALNKLRYESNVPVSAYRYSW